jgi:diguanylate cyclase (GGDEF)-like protein
VAYLTPRYDLWVVFASILLACFASFVALDLAKRVRAKDGRVARTWWIAGSIAMGTGIWAMHFVGMLAFSLPMVLGYTRLLTFGSWGAAVAVSGVALSVAGRGTLTPRRLAGGALTMGAGICVMHYTGMAALDMVPGIVWRWDLVALSAAIAVAASAAALLIFFWLRRASSPRRNLAYQIAAAIVMGLAISGMHYTGMAAARFPEGTVCLSANALGGDSLGTLVLLASAAMLAVTLFTSIRDARMQDKTARSADLLRVANAHLGAANAQLRSANEELQRRVDIDALTGLPTRRLFEDRLAHAIARNERTEGSIAARDKHGLAVLFINLDRFRPVNDSFGHAAGDIVLEQAASRLRSTARNSDTVARVGGDGFLVLMEDAASVADCETLARRLIEALERPFDVLNRQVEISGSVGIAVYPDHGQRDKLAAHAEAAMHVAKRLGGGTCALFESKMEAGALEQVSLLNDLRHAIELGQLSLHYQPKIDGQRGQIRGVEALLRWQHPQRGMVSPVVFIPIAERSGLIVGLGNWVIDEACRQMQAWADVGVRMRVAVNVSAHQLRKDDLVERIRQALDRHQVEASQLLCEITESVAMEDIKSTQRVFEGLERIGVYLSIDDFGTGYSSLSYLRQLPAKQLKIDRSFVNDLESSSDARAIVDAVTRLAHALGLLVVAEGVETEGQRDILLQLGCDELQGYFFAKPMPADALLAWAVGRKPEGAVDFSPSVVDDTLR